MKRQKKQQNRVLMWLEDHGTITVKQAMDELGIGDLRGVLRDLRNSGHCIVREDVVGVNRFGEQVKFGRWSLEKGEN